MEIDPITIEDLSIFNRDETYSLFHRFDFTRTSGGKDYLHQIYSRPLDDIEKIKEIQDVVRFIAQNLDRWPLTITNGTLRVVEKYLSTKIAPPPYYKGAFFVLEALVYKIFNSTDYGVIKFSYGHFIGFVDGFETIVERFNHADTPIVLKRLFDRANELLQHNTFKEIMHRLEQKKFQMTKVLAFEYYMRRRYRSVINELSDIYCQLDAYFAMAKAVNHFKLKFPEFTTEKAPYVNAQKLYHPLLESPVSYDIKMEKEQNFLFLTGANMAGKSTFIKAMGVSVFLAHIGMGVPAEHMQLSLFDGVLSNIQIQDNIFKGESYFFNEVQRIKKTIIQVEDGRHWLILIDELFKGTNIEDAKNCSAIVIKGLLQNHKCIFILSTHLYEIGEELRPYPNIIFKYFEVKIAQDTIKFNYQLLDGISQDRLAYLILKKENVIDLLEKMGE